MSNAKVYVIHENIEWTQHLVKWLEKIQVPYELWDLSSGILDLQSPPPQGIFYNRMSASSHTRGHRYAPEFTEQVLTWLEAHGRKVVNGTGAVNLEISKVKQYLKLNESGIETPATVAVLGPENIIEAARKLNIYPLITKHNRAGKGLGVQLFQNEEETSEVVQYKKHLERFITPGMYQENKSLSNVVKLETGQYVTVLADGTIISN